MTITEFDWSTPYLNLEVHKTAQDNLSLDIHDRLIQGNPVDLTRDYELSKGKRLRAFSSLFYIIHTGILHSERNTSFNKIKLNKNITYGKLYNAYMKSNKFNEVREFTADLPFRTNIQNKEKEIIYSIQENVPLLNRDPDIHPALQDLADEINEDIREACFAFDNPDLYYPGVDDGIEPVTDDHVSLVIWGLQRELKRELRALPGGNYSDKLPAAPLDELPWNIQRALTERRRLRYSQWGITKKEWLENRWSLLNVPEDPDYVPRRASRLSNV